jgi:hypothetical protein
LTRCEIQREMKENEGLGRKRIVGLVVALWYGCIERSRSLNTTSSATNRHELCHIISPADCMTKYSGRQALYLCGTVALTTSYSTRHSSAIVFVLNGRRALVWSTCLYDSKRRTVPGTMPQCRYTVYPCVPHSRRWRAELESLWRSKQATPRYKMESPVGPNQWI